jgi:phosphomannomutase
MTAFDLRQDLENRDLDPWEEYRKHFQKFVTNWKPFSIVIDAANAMGGYAFDRVFPDFPGKLTRLFFEPDGNFPNHEANPLKAECLEDLQKKVLATQADFGVAFDGDADRCVFVDNQGETVSCDLVTALFAEHFLKEEAGAGVVYDLRSSRVVSETIEKLGGRPYRDRVGHSHMKKTLRETKSVFGGELSGHYYFRDHADSDSGLMAFVLMMNLLSNSPGNLSEKMKSLKIYSQSGEINFRIEDKDKAIENLARHFSSGRQDRLDGLTVAFDDWWFNVRKSNTEPFLRLNLEADTAKLCQSRVNEIRNLLEALSAQSA